MGPSRTVERWEEEARSRSLRSGGLNQGDQNNNVIDIAKWNLRDQKEKNKHFLRVSLSPAKVNFWYGYETENLLDSDSRNRRHLGFSVQKYLGQ